MPRYNCIYTLNKKSPVEAWNEEAGVRVRLTLGEPYLRVEGVSADSPEQVFTSARETAERFLDGVSRDCDANLAIVSDEVNVEVLDDQGNVTGYAVTATAIATVDVGIRVVHKDANGNVLHEYDSARPGPIALATSDAPRYFRKARTSLDVFDKFRNFYYVVEYVGSRLKAHLRPKGFGGEQGLIRFALEQAFPGQAERLRGAARMVPGIDSATDVYEAVAEFLYDRNRKELQHAKVSMTRKVPFRQVHEKAVRDAIPLAEAIARRLLAVEKQKFGP